MKASDRLYLISDDELRTPVGGADVEVASAVFLEATLYEDLGADRGDDQIREQDKGDTRGSLHGFLVRGQRGLTLCSFTFVFGDQDSITATGVLPNQAPSVGRGVLALAGGTGQFHGWTGEVRLEVVTNPKRWSIDSP